VRLSSWSPGRRYEHTDPLGDPGTCLTTAVSNNVLWREPLPTVRAHARATGLTLLMQTEKKSKDLDGLFTCRVQSDYKVPTCAPSKEMPCYHMQ
jgi:hypothetical protein